VRYLNEPLLATPQATGYFPEVAKPRMRLSEA